MCAVSVTVSVVVGAIVVRRNRKRVAGTRRGKRERERVAGTGLVQARDRAAEALRELSVPAPENATFSLKVLPNSATPPPLIWTLPVPETAVVTSSVPL